MISFVLAESELEMVPEKLLSHPAVVSSAKRRGKKPEEILLDSNFHHNALKGIEDGERRGRPDIAHVFLLVALESIANKRGLIKDVIIHTRNDDVIYINPKTRIMRSYNRFVGLIEHLFTVSDKPDGNRQLLRLERNVSLESLIKNLKADRVAACTRAGKKVNVYNYLERFKGENDIVFIIGGFPKGDFKTDVEKIADDLISIYTEPLTAWSVVGEIVAVYNLVCGF
ncbi:MAG TPA: 16S rRNA methyltransferase [Thermoplasmatales archaeon]|nr:16S rRNA methyltransferase [Thermoplasmatales archaeon]